jgi:glycosyltransferase involved in cell wall biosynthesis
MEKASNKITVIIIAKNEEIRIGICIASVTWADKIIVIDNGSTDKTEEVARRANAVTIKTDQHDFSELRMLGLRLLKTDWVLYVDADEVVSPELALEIRKIISQNYTNNNINAYRVIRKNYYFGNYLWPHDDKLERLFKTNSLKGWIGKVHESPIISGQTGDIMGVLIHHTHRNLEEMIQKTNEWSQIEAQLRVQSNHPRIVWWRLVRVFWTAFSDSFFKQKGYTAGTVGWIESLYQGFSMFITYAKLWELQKSAKTHVE